MAFVPCVAPAKLFIGILYRDTNDRDSVQSSLTELYGTVDCMSDPVPFAHTEYYTGIGSCLHKLLLSYTVLIPREQLATIKHQTNTIEASLPGKDGPRRVNIDPGYLTLSNVYLASCNELSSGIHR